jgi:hypothetical protein
MTLNQYIQHLTSWLIEDQYSFTRKIVEFTNTFNKLIASEIDDPEAIFNSEDSLGSQEIIQQWLLTKDNFYNALLLLMFKYSNDISREVSTRISHGNFQTNYPTHYIEGSFKKTATLTAFAIHVLSLVDSNNSNSEFSQEELDQQINLMELYE